MRWKQPFKSCLQQWKLEWARIEPVPYDICCNLFATKTILDNTLDGTFDNILDNTQCPVLSSFSECYRWTLNFGLQWPEITIGSCLWAGVSLFDRQAGEKLFSEKGPMGVKKVSGVVVNSIELSWNLLGILWVTFKPRTQELVHREIARAKFKLKPL